MECFSGDRQEIGEESQEKGTSADSSQKRPTIALPQEVPNQGTVDEQLRESHRVRVCVPVAAKAKGVVRIGGETHQKREKEENKEILSRIKDEICFKFPDGSREKINAEIKKKFRELKKKKIQQMYKVGLNRIKKRKTSAGEWPNSPSKRWF